MKTRKVQSLALSAMLLLTTSMAWARPDHDDRDDRGQRGSQAHYSQDHGRGNQDRRDYGDRYRRGYVVAPPRWHRGGYVSTPYRAHRYVVYNYGYYGLPRPAPGHRWVRVDNDFLLTAVATGVIISIITAH